MKWQSWRPGKTRESFQVFAPNLHPRAKKQEPLSHRDMGEHLLFSQAGLRDSLVCATRTAPRAHSREGRARTQVMNLSKGTKTSPHGPVQTVPVRHNTLVM